MASIEERVSRLEGGAQHLATKADIAEVKGEIAATKAEVKGEIAATKAEVKGEIAATKAEVKGEIASLRSWVAGGLAALGIVLVVLNVALRFWV